MITPVALAHALFTLGFADRAVTATAAMGLRAEPVLGDISLRRPTVA